RRLEQLAGKHPAVDALCSRLEERLRMTCPRCGAERRKPEMIRHLWDEHRLLLVGRRVREPWAPVEDWAPAARHGHPAGMLERCRIVATLDDPEDGVLRLGRLLLARHVEDAEARRMLLDVAEEQHATLCPHCFAAAPVPREAAPWVLTRRGGRISAHGYLVEISEAGWRTRLEVRTPGRLVYRGPEPDLSWTPRGLVSLLVGPFVALALACAFGLIDWGGPPFFPVLWLLAAGLIVYVGVLLELRRRP